MTNLGLRGKRSSLVLPLSCGAQERPQRSFPAHCQATDAGEGIFVLHLRGAPIVGVSRKARVSKPEQLCGVGRSRPSPSSHWQKISANQIQRDLVYCNGSIV